MLLAASLEVVERRRPLRQPRPEREAVYLEVEVVSLETLAPIAIPRRRRLQLPLASVDLARRNPQIQVALPLPNLQIAVRFTNLSSIYI